MKALARALLTSFLLAHSVLGFAAQGQGQSIDELCREAARSAAVLKLRIDTNDTSPNPEVTDLYEMDPGQYAVEVSDEESTYHYVVDTRPTESGTKCDVLSVVAN